MATNIGAVLALDGVNKYKQGMKVSAEITKQFNTQLKTIASQFKVTGNSEQTLVRQNTVLGQSLQNSKNKMSLLRGELSKQKAELTRLGAAMDKANKEYGENSVEAQKATSAYARQQVAVSKLQTQYSKAESEVADMTARLNQNESELKQVRSGMDNASKSAKRFGDETKRSTDKGTIGIRGIATAIGLVKVASMAFNYVRGQIDSAFGRLDTMTQFNKTITVMTKSTDITKQAFKEVDEAVTGTAYALDSGARAVQNFVTSGMDIKKSTKQLSVWGDAVAFYGDGSTETLNTVTEAIGKMTAKGKIDMEQMNRLTEAGIPALQIFAEATGRSTQQVMDSMKKGEITAEEFTTAMQKALTKGTKSFAGIEGAAKDAEGVYSTAFANIKTAVTRGIADMISAIDKGLKGAGLGSIGDNLDKLKNGINSAFKAVGKTVPKILQILSKVVTVIKDLLPLIVGIGVGVAVFSAVSKAVKAFDAVMKILNTTMLSMPILAVVSAVAALGTAFYGVYKDMNKVKDGYADMKASRDEALASAQNEATTLDKLYERYDELINIEGKSKSQREELKDIIDQLNGSVEGLGLQYDVETDKANKSRKAIKKAIEERKKQIIQDSIAEQQKKLLADRIQAEIDLENKKAQLSKVNTEIERISQESKWGWTPKTAAQMEKLVYQQKKLETGIKDTNDALDTMAVDYEDVNSIAAKAMAPKNVNELNKALKSLVEDTKYAGEEIPEVLEKAFLAGEIKVPTSVKRLNNLVNTEFLDIVQKTKDTMGKLPENIALGLQTGEMSVSVAKKRLEKILELESLKTKYSEEVQGAISTLITQIDMGDVPVKSATERLKAAADFEGMDAYASVAGTKTGDALVSGLLSGEISTKEAARLLNLAVRGELNKDSAVDVLGKKRGKKFAKGIGSTTGDVGKETAKLPEEGNKILKDKKDSGKPWGVEFGKGWGLGIGSLAVKEVISTGATSIVGWAIKKIKEKQESKSPSRLAFREGGEMFGFGYAKGMSSKKVLSEIGKSAKTVIKNTVAVLNSAIAGDTSKVKSGITTLLKDLNKSTTAEVKKHSSKLVSLSNSMSKVNKKLDEAKKKLKDAKEAMKSYAETVKGAFTSLTQLSGMEGISSATDYLSRLTKNYDVAKDFKKNIQALKKLGLNKETIDELIGMGAEKGNEIASSLLNGADKNIIAQINQMKVNIESVGTSLGKSLSKSYYQAGVDSAKGIIKGLKSQQTKIEKQIKSLGKLIAKTIRKELKIKSPSRIMVWIGKMLDMGLIKGMLDNAKKVKSAAASVSKKTIDGFGFNPGLSSAQITASSKADQGLTAKDIASAVLEIAPIFAAEVTDSVKGISFKINNRELARIT